MVAVDAVVEVVETVDVDAIKTAVVIATEIFADDATDLDADGNSSQTKPSPTPQVAPASILPEPAGTLPSTFVTPARLDLAAMAN